MLVLTRLVQKDGRDSFVIDPKGLNIRIKVLSIDRKSVKVGIEAPIDVLVVREELLEGPETK